MKRKPRQILDLEIDEISLVDKGANQHAIVTIAKSANGDKENYMDIFDEQGQPVDHDELELGDVVYDADGQAYELTDDGEDYEDDEVEKSLASFATKAGMQTRSAGARAYNAGTRASRKVTRSGRRASALGRELRTNPGAMGPHTRTGQAAANRAAGYQGKSSTSGVGDGFRRMQQGLGFGESGRRYALKSPTAVRNNRIAAGAGAGGVAGLAGTGAYAYDRKVNKSYSEELREELSKALTDEDRDNVISKAFDDIEYLAEAAEIAKAAAEEERQIRLEREYYEVAKSYDLPIDPEELGRTLMRAAEYLDEEDCEVIGKALSYASEAADYLFDEHGAIGGGDNSDVMSQVSAIVDETVSKSAGYGAEELTAEFFANNPGAYDDYLAGY